MSRIEDVDLLAPPSVAPPSVLLPPMSLDKWADELQTLVASGDNSYADIKLQVESKIVPVCIFCLGFCVQSLLVALSVFNFTGVQVDARRPLGRFSCDV